MVAQHCWPSPSLSLVFFQLMPEGLERAWPTPADTRPATSSLPACSGRVWTMPRDPRPFSHSPRSFPLLRLSPSHALSAAVGAAHCRRGHYHCLASPPCSRDPPPSPMPSRRPTCRRTLPSALTVIFFNPGHRRSHHRSAIFGASPTSPTTPSSLP